MTPSPLDTTAPEKVRYLTILRPGQGDGLEGQSDGRSARDCRRMADEPARLAGGTVFTTAARGPHGAVHERRVPREPRTVGHIGTTLAAGRSAAAGSGREIPSKQSGGGPTDRSAGETGACGPPASSHRQAVEPHPPDAARTVARVRTHTSRAGEPENGLGWYPGRGPGDDQARPVHHHQQHGRPESHPTLWKGRDGAEVGREERDKGKARRHCSYPRADDRSTKC